VIPFALGTVVGGIEARAGWLGGRLGNRKRPRACESPPIDGTAVAAGTPPPPHPPDRKGAIREQLRSPALSPTILDTSVFRGDRGRDGFFQTGFRTHPQVTA